MRRTCPRLILWKLAAAVIATSLSAQGAMADAAFGAWVEAFWPTAEKAGISRELYDRAFANIDSPDPAVLKSASHQAEFVKPIWSYIDTAASDARIKQGRLMLRRHAPTFDAIEATYGVDRHVVAAIWGMESSYGAVLGQPGIVRPVIRSLATLAYADDKRRNFGRRQLIAALSILKDGDASLKQMTGSWAGAMGHTQFIPTTYQSHAVDFDGDGRRNIWSSIPDALASTANYLSAEGWQTGRTWGYEVKLPESFNYDLADEKTQRPVAEWAAMGIVRTGERAFPHPDDDATLLLPAGSRGPAFLMLKNFRVLKKYNNANAYALAVGHLADRMMGSGAIATAWPRSERSLKHSERRELQALLAAQGFSPGKIDGKLGLNSRDAIRSYQSKAGLLPDGYAGPDLLMQLRAAGR